VPVDLGPDGQAFLVSAAAEHEVAPLVAAVVVHAALAAAVAGAALPFAAVAARVALAAAVARVALAVAARLADHSADVSSAAAAAAAVAAAVETRVAPVGFAPERIRDAFEVVAAAAEQLLGAAVAAVLQRVRLAAAAVAPVSPHAQLAVRLHHDRYGVVRSAVAVAPAQCGADQAAHFRCPAAFELAEQPVVTFARFAVHRVPVAHLVP
jgi:hypothetical protein